ncbi:hypothetical protein [Nitratifractor sp.]
MLILKYAVIGAVSVVSGVYLAALFGYTTSMGYPAVAIAGAAGGAFGGWMRQRRGKTN